MAIPRQAAKREIDAVYEHGVFRVLEPADVPLAEGQRVHLIVETLQPETDEGSLKLLDNFYEGLSEEDIQEIEKVMLTRRNLRNKPLDLGEA